MNSNTRTSLSRLLRTRGGYALALGGLAVAIQVACSDQPTNGSTYAPVAGTAGTPATTAGTTSTTAGTGGAAAGTFSTGGATAGTFTTGGAGASTGGGGTGGDTTAGMSGGGTGGNTSAGMAGTGGQVVLTAYCMGKTPSTLPYTVNEGFQLSGWNQGAVDQAVANADPKHAADLCTTRVPNAVGGCSTWTFTAKLASGFAYVQWITKWDAMYTHPPVCIDPAAMAVSFAAKGAKGGEKVTFAAGGGMQDKEITLTNKWETYFVPLAGVDFNTFDTGVVEGFEWKIVPTADAPAIDFAIDNIQWVKDAPVDGAGGAGGATM